MGRLTPRQASAALMQTEYDAQDTFRDFIRGYVEASAVCEAITAVRKAGDDQRDAWLDYINDLRRESVEAEKAA